MKFRNILLTTFAASAFVIGTTSCSDSFLDEKMYSSYGPEAVSYTHLTLPTT